MFVTTEDGCAFLAFDGHRSKFGVEPSSRNGPSRACLRHERIFILLFARNLVTLGQHLGGFAHHHFCHGTKESVAIHAIDQILVAQPVSPARFEKVRNARHRLRAAGQNATRIAEQNRLVRQRNRFYSRSAGLVHRERRNFLRDAAADGNLTRWIRTAPGLPRVAEDGFFHLLWLDSGAFHRGLRGNDAHVSRRQGRQRPSKLPNRRPYRRANVDCLQTGTSKHFNLAAWRTMLEGWHQSNVDFNLAFVDNTFYNWTGYAPG